MSVASRNYAASSRSAQTSTARGPPAQDFNTVPTAKDVQYFNPCAATAYMFLYAQGSSVMCCHHDTLAIDRTFSQHADEIQLLAVDNVSEQGAGRLVVSYDAGQTAIVWDLMTGDEMSRFASYEHLTTASWMRNGNVAFGNTQGNIILFEPTTSEHISSRTIDQIAVTALAPSADCRTFAIGYSNGSLLVATLQPRFTILHNLTTSKGPSPIVTLAWHASSPRQKSDMLAVQTHDGDLRVWSVTKSYHAEDPPKVVRILRRNENYATGPNWMGWSKNGRIIQFSNSETLSWDVRTKHVTHDSIPTLQHVKGIALYGPGASLFTVGPNNSVQQFDLNSPAIMVANVQHPAGILPPSPPTSDEIGGRSTHSTSTSLVNESDRSSIPLGIPSESEDEQFPSFAQRAGQPDPESGYDIYESASTISSRSDLSSASRSSAGSQTPGKARSVRSRAMTEYTHISAGSSLKSSTVGKRNVVDNYSLGYTLPSTSVPSIASSKSRHRPSGLRNEVPRSPDEGNMAPDLFQYTRSRLSDIPYKPLQAPSSLRLTNDDLRRQMLSTIFGWHGEVQQLVRDEMTRHPAGSTNRILLAKWLGDMNLDILAAGSGTMTTSDWMFLALCGINGQPAQQKLGRAYVQRLLGNNELHVAVTIMLGVGDQNDAIEAYISHKRYMEALILACMIFPSVWERQAAIIRKWGEWAVQHGQQQLAIRCFACTGQESTEPWTSPSATQLTFQGITTSIPEVLSPPLSPPGLRLGPQRSIASTLKLITSFGDQNQKSRFFPQLDGGQTPIAAGVTPIADTALSPGAGYEQTTAFLRPSNNSRFNTPTTARPVGPSFSRARLPSIGESPRDPIRDGQDTFEIALPAMENSIRSRAGSVTQDNASIGRSLQRATTADPMMMRDTFQRVAQVGHADRSDSPDHAALGKMQSVQTSQKPVPRDRNTRGLQLQLQPLQALDQLDSKYHWPSRRRGPGSVASSVTSASSAARSVRTGHRQKDHDGHMQSLEAAQFYSKRSQSRPGSKDRVHESVAGRHKSRERIAKSRDPSEERGRTPARASNNSKGSPTSPISMSPRDLAILGRPQYPENAVEPMAMRKPSHAKVRATSRASSRGQRRGIPASRSPSPPVPLSAVAMHYEGSEDEEDYQRAVQAREEFRAKHCRSANRGLNSPAVARQELLEMRLQNGIDSVDTPEHLGHSFAPAERAGDLRQAKDERQRKKEQAARDLEERRRSLAKRQLVTPIPHPNEISSAQLPAAMEADEDVSADDDSPRSSAELPKSKFARSTQHYIGLPATPKAMKFIPRSGDQAEEVPPLPALPAAGQSLNPPPKAEEGGSLLTLLPSTVYQPPSKPMIPRSMSAPIPEDVSSPRRFRRKGSVGEMRGLGNILEDQVDNKERMPPPPPPPPAQPVLQQLKHLAMPPPPPPVPLPHMPRSVNSGGALGSGMIEIVMDDDDDDDDDDQPEESEVVAPNDGMVPVLPLPLAPFRGHERRRSNGQGSISGRSSRATENMRSASRSRKNSIKTQHQDVPAEVVAFNHLRSPTSNMPPPMAAMYGDPGLVRLPPFEYHQRKNSTGLHESEMF